MVTIIRKKAPNTKNFVFSSKGAKKYTESTGVKVEAGVIGGNAEFIIKAPKEQFKNSQGASRVTSVTDKEQFTKAEIAQSLAIKQQVSKDSRAYATAAAQSVENSSRRRIDKPQQNVGVYDTYQINNSKVINTGNISLAPDRTSNGVGQGTFLTFLTPDDNKPKIVSLAPTANKKPSLTSDVIGGAKAALKIVGYGVGEPFRVVGLNVEKVGSKIKNFGMGRNSQTISSWGYGIQKVGEFTKSGGEGLVKKPGVALASIAIAGAISYGIKSTKLIGTAAAPYIRNFVPESVITKTPKLIETGAVTVLGGSYVFYAGKRIATSTRPASTAGEIFSTEILPFGYGGRIGDKAFAYSQEAGTKIYTKAVGAEFISKKVIAPKYMPKSSSPQDALNQFLNQKNAYRKADGLIVYHSTVFRLPKQFSPLPGRGATSRKDPLGLFVAPSAPIWPLRLGQAKEITYSILPSPINRPNIAAIEVANVKRLPANIRTADNAIDLSNVYSASRVGRGEAYITARREKGYTSEAEANIYLGNKLDRLNKGSYRKYTLIEGKIIPIQEFKLRVTSPKSLVETVKSNTARNILEGKYKNYANTKALFSTLPFSYRPMPRYTINTPSYSFSPRGGSRMASSATATTRTINVPQRIISVPQRNIGRDIVRIPDYSADSRSSIDRATDRQLSRTTTTTRYVRGAKTNPLLIGTVKLPKIRLFGDRKKSSLLRRRPFKYQASLSGIVGKKRTNKKKLEGLTGFEIRPVPAA